MLHPLELVVLGSVALVLASAGVAKLRSGHDRAARVTGIAELLLAVGLLVGPSRLTAGLAATVFAGFTFVHLRRRQPSSAAEAGCDCFGQASAPSGTRQATLTAVVVVATLSVAIGGASASPVAGAASAPAGALAGSVGALAAAWLWRAAFLVSSAQITRAGETLVARSAAFVERRISRRTALVRLATAGSALTVAPLRYLLYPGTALAAIAPGDCGGGLCTDGYTAFCCEINHGSNSCPAGTYAGGWWKCTDYTGRQLCHEQGVRYYVDCNRIPGTYFPGGCHCANDTCEHRRVACNVFRYGQCNTQVRGVTEVVCRMVVCENPSEIPELHCSSSLAVDNAVCAHEAPCLTVPEAVVVGPAGGV
jgi:hypothetical protein